MARRETTRHAGDENVHRRGGAREAGARARHEDPRVRRHGARPARDVDREASRDARIRVRGYHQPVRAEPGRRSRRDQIGKRGSWGRRAAALLVDPAGLSEEISEVEEWAAALNDRGVRDARIDLERADQDMPPGGGFEDEDEDEDEDDASSEGQRCSSESEIRRAAAARDAEIAKMRQVLEISSRVREMCDARTAELEATRAELRAAEARAAAAEASRAETEATARAAGARALALVRVVSARDGGGARVARRRRDGGGRGGFDVRGERTPVAGRAARDGKGARPRASRA